MQRLEDVNKRLEKGEESVQREEEGMRHQPGIPVLSSSLRKKNSDTKRLKEAKKRSKNSEENVYVRQAGCERENEQHSKNKRL